ncbi:MarR family winged helix-turn-helix transcriptional regulator [Sphaerisporangium corydalis]|uniref:MarR family winged helix-turn-helix transcriptional regulator n=1 Tax=Sphaerisporangium corydalis TaxID=1441875 RepID=A0ABV9E9Y3_9ACTN|nr:MarR family transcriptional regulator [Sphaerisporangium corydalis]
MTGTSGDYQDDPDTYEALAEDLLASVVALRRASRRAAGRGPVFASLTGAQADLVRLLYLRPGLGVAAAAAELGMAANSVSTLVGRLTTAGLVRRTQADGDRRAASLELTDDARRRMSEWRDRRAAAVAGALARMDAGERERLAAAVEPLRRLADGVEKE